MSVKPKKVDDCVVERRLRPVYEWLDNGNNKKAVQECEKVLKKTPKLQCARVLKALALFRLGKRRESEALISDVVKEGSTDEMTLQALTICYREMHQPEKICKVYEAAVESEPTNEELMSHLFMSYVRVGNYKMQQITALKLYKLKSKNPYYYWAVMSIVMQAQKSKDSRAKQISLELAERMVAKFAEDGRLDAESEVWVFLYIYELQEKYYEALKIIDGPLSSKIVQQPQNFVTLKRADYYTKLECYEEANAIYKDIIIKEPDNWQHYENYTHLIVIMCLKNIDNLCGTLEEAESFLRGARNRAISEKLAYRAPLLGLLHFAKILQKNDLAHARKELFDEIPDLLLYFIKQYGHKLCCFGDVTEFIHLIVPDRILDFLENCYKLIEFNDVGVPIDINSIYRHHTWLQLCQVLGQNDCLSPPSKIEKANSLVSMYQETKHLSVDVADMDIRPNDMYLILASHLYLSALSSLSDSSNVDVCQLVIRIAAILEYGISISKANFQLKLLLLKIYNMIGATGASSKVYEMLDFKQIQLDSLGYLFSFQALDSGNFSSAKEIFSNTLKFFMANYKDTSEPLIMSYKYGSLVRIPEFVDFRERLDNSIHFAFTTAEHILLDLSESISSHVQLQETMEQLSIDPSLDKTDWDNLRDNRDHYVMNSWEPKWRRINDDIIRESFQLDIQMLKLRSLVLRLIGAAIKVVSTGLELANKENSLANGETNGEKDILAELIEELKQEYTSCHCYKNSDPPLYPVQGPDVPRIYIYMKGGYISLILHHLYVLHWIRDHAGDLSESVGSPCEPLVAASEIMEDLVSAHIGHLESFRMCPVSSQVVTLNRDSLIQITHFIQSLGLVVILLGCCHSILRPLKTAAMRHRKKKKSAVDIPPIVSQFSDYITTSLELFQKFESALREKVSATPQSEMDMNAEWLMDGKAFVAQEYLRVVCAKIYESYLMCFEKLTASFMSKVKYMTSLRL